SVLPAESLSMSRTAPTPIAAIRIQKSRLISTSRKRVAFARHAAAARFPARSALDRFQPGWQFGDDAAARFRRHPDPGTNFLTRATAPETEAGFHIDRTDQDARGFDGRHD